MIKPPERFELTQGDLNSSTWMRLSKYMNERLATLRAQNDHEMTEERTATLRGRIAEIKALLAFETPIEPLN